MATNRSSEIRKDPIHNRYVIFSPARARRPMDFKSKSKSNSNTNTNTQTNCPFCSGNEHQCAPEIFRYPPESTSNWNTRVIQNLYPALNQHIDTTCNHHYSFNGHVSLPGFGFHDVVIETPTHSVHLSDLEPVQVANVLFAYKKRIRQFLHSPEIKYVQVFKNHGASAGASMSHSHSQILALPIVPSNVNARSESMKGYFEETGECGLCEVRRGELLVDETEHFVAVVPYAGSFPFEIWIVPRQHASHFHELDDEKVLDLGGILKLMLVKMSLQLNNPPYNFMIHSAPLQVDSTHLPFSHWFIQLVPQLTVVGGFELGTGCYINPVMPEDAAKVLRDVRVPN